ncbi:MAG: hypothetical protein B7C24_12660 [Bacteroidetes bacterium 4572_77]|nr:MAG: hypothetical protein B7C24_12660 [Bacteroidetes bacterium 4572_77]
MSNKLEIDIYPIPCTDFISIKVFKKLVTKVKVYLIDNKGEVDIPLFEDYLKKGENILKLDISMIKKGKYFLFYLDEEVGIKMKMKMKEIELI